MNLSVKPLSEFSGGGNKADLARAVKRIAEADGLIVGADGRGSVLGGDDVGHEKLLRGKVMHIIYRCDGLGNR